MVPALATARLQAADTRARRLVRAVSSASVSKRGFNNIFAEPLTAVNVAVFDRFEDGAVVDAAALIEKGILHDCKYGLKVLGNGSVSKKVTVKAAAFSESAKEKIEKAGGKAEVV